MSQVVSCDVCKSNAGSGSGYHIEVRRAGALALDSIYDLCYECEGKFISMIKSQTIPTDKEVA